MMFISLLQAASWEFYDVSRWVFFMLSLFIVLTQLWFLVRCRRYRKPKALYHYTSLTALNDMANSKIIQGGVYGRVFTTANPTLKKHGSGNSRKKERGTVVFTCNALAAFRDNSGGFLLWLSGAKFTADFNNEHLSRQHGHLRLINFKRIFNTLIVNDVSYKNVGRLESLYMHTMKKLLTPCKYIQLFTHLISAGFLINIFFPSSSYWYSNNWLLISLMIFSLCLLSQLSAHLLHFGFKLSKPRDFHIFP